MSTSVRSASAAKLAAFGRVGLGPPRPDLPEDLEPEQPEAALADAGLPEAGLPEAGLPEAGLPEAASPHAASPVPVDPAAAETAPMVPLDAMWLADLLAAETRPIPLDLGQLADPVIAQANQAPVPAAGPASTALAAAPLAASTASRRRLRRDIRRPPRGPRTVRSDLLRDTARGLLVTPWFAAGVGIVIAAGMAIYAPHAEFTFPSAIGVEHCAQPDCLAGAGGKASLAASGRQPLRGPRSSTAHNGRDAHSDRSAASGLKFTIAVVWQGNGMFDATISVTGKGSLKSWRLAFRMPGDQIKVIGAAWSPYASGDGGVAGAYPGSPSGGPGGPGGYGGSGSHQVGITFFVLGTGKPVMPTDCRFDGAACRFTMT